MNAIVVLDQQNLALLERLVNLAMIDVNHSARMRLLGLLVISARVRRQRASSRR